MTDVNHAERAHSMLSASGAVRWLNCAASVWLEEKSPPSQDNFWSREGTLAHEVLESMLNRQPVPDNFAIDSEMVNHCERAANKIRALHKVHGGTLLIEKKVFASFIHPEMFGTCDAIIAGTDGVLHIIDFKYGAGHVVSPIENPQLIQYALSVAESYDWKFIEIKLWILQPRAGDDWYKSFSITMKELRFHWLPLWEKGVKRVLAARSGLTKPQPGGHCHWCRAKAICPAKVLDRSEKASSVFKNSPIEGKGQNGGKEENIKSKGQSRKAFKSEAQRFGNLN